MPRSGLVPGAPFFGGSFAKMYLGGNRVPTVPSAPTIISATYVLPDLFVEFTAPSDNGGSALLPFDGGGYKVYANGSFEGASFINGTSRIAILTGEFSGAQVQVSAVNAVGEGPKSAAVTAT